MSTVSPRAVVVTRPTEYEQLVARHGTREQARFFLARSDRTLDALDARQLARDSAVTRVLQAVPPRWRRARVDRGDLSRFVFGPEDVVCVVGQDGLVANVAKYLHGQPVIGFNPDRAANDGVLVRHAADAADDLFAVVASGRARFERRTMVEARTGDGQRLVALNELFVGHASHQSARYALQFQGVEEAQSSSGLLFASGTGATGWARSVVRQRGSAPPLPTPEEPRGVFLVREAFPSVATGTTLDAGSVAEGETLTLRSQMDDRGTIFGDGIESDRIVLAWGMTVKLGVARERLHLVAA